MLTFAVKKKRTPSIAPKRHAPTVSPMSHSLHLQQAKVHHILRGPTLQPKLTIGQPNDKYEQEADRVAEQVMRKPEPRLQRQVEPEEEEEETLQPKPLVSQITPLVQVQRQEEPEEEEEEPIQTKRLSHGSSPVTAGLESQVQSLKGGGQPLPASERAFFEPRFGRDFSNVRVHTDNRATRTAQTINARAFTLGRDVVFGAGQYSPGSRSGRSLLAHELTHVVQQNGVIPGRRKRVGCPLSTLCPPVSTSIQRQVGTRNDPKKYKRSTNIMIDYSKPRKKMYLWHLRNKKKVTDSMIMLTEQFHYMIRWRVPYHRAILACRMILADVKRGVNVTAAKTMKYVWKARDKIRHGPTKRIVAQGWGAYLGTGLWRLWNFEYNKSNLRIGHMLYLDKAVICHLKHLIGIEVVIKLSGHASQSGKNRELGLINYELALKRAQSVEKYLSAQLLKPKYRFKYEEIEYRKAHIPFEPNVHENYKDRAVVIIASYKKKVKHYVEHELEEERWLKAKFKRLFFEVHDIIKEHNITCDQLRNSNWCRHKKERDYKYKPLGKKYWMKTCFYILCPQEGRFKFWSYIRWQLFMKKIKKDPSFLRAQNYNKFNKRIFNKWFDRLKRGKEL